jgi:hypothetical protein
MAESRPGTGDGAKGGADTPPRMPRWVKLSGLAGAGLLAVAVVVAVASGGEHGPGRHLGAAASEAGALAEPDAGSPAGRGAPTEPAAPP